MILAGVTALLAALFYFFGVQTMAWYQFRVAEGSELLWVIPRPRVVATAPPGGQPIACHGLRLRVPWARAERVKPCMFSSGPTLISIADPASWDAPPRDELNKLWRRPDRSEHEAFGEMLSATPASLSVFMRREEAARIGVTLLAKTALLAFPGETGLYSFRAGPYHGFQAGDPKRSRFVEVHLFDEDGLRGGFTLVANRVGDLAWREIDHILGSVE